MHVYLTTKSIPELSGLPPSERRRILRHCSPMTFRHWEAWVAVAACVVCAGLGAYLGVILLPTVWGAGWIGGVLGAAIGGAFLGQVKGMLVRPYIRAYQRSESAVATQNR
jgi:hypothetical protein